MIKNKKWTLILTSVLILLPTVFGLIAWNSLPDKMATHWNASGEVDGWSSKAFAVFFIPLFLFTVHWVCIFATFFDKKNADQNSKIMTLCLWVTPLISILVSYATYSQAFGININVARISLILIGVIFIIIGNYLPKTMQNHTIGIKIPWTLKSEENWNATHRFCGKLWVCGGILFVICSFLPSNVAFIVLLSLVALLVLTPMIYSFVYHKRHQ